MKYKRGFPEQYPFRDHPAINAVIHVALIMVVGFLLGMMPH